MIPVKIENLKMKEAVNKIQLFLLTGLSGSLAFSIDSFRLTGFLVILIAVFALTSRFILKLAPERISLRLSYFPQCISYTSLATFTPPTRMLLPLSWNGSYQCSFFLWPCTRYPDCGVTS